MIPFSATIVGTTFKSLKQFIEACRAGDRRLITPEKHVDTFPPRPSYFFCSVLTDESAMYDTLTQMSPWFYSSQATYPKLWSCSSFHMGTWAFCSCLSDLTSAFKFL